jgi:hypothetical protein
VEYDGSGYKIIIKPSTVGLPVIPALRSETGGSRVQGQPWLCNETLKNNDNKDKHFIPEVIECM